MPLEPVELAGVRVLVAVDNSTERHILDERLKSWGMKPTLIDRGEAALRKIEEVLESGDPFRLLLTDSDLPKMDGYQLVERIQHDPRIAGLAAVMLSSLGQRGDATRCRRLGISAYLTKPVGESELLEVIQRVLGQDSSKKKPSSLITQHSLREFRQGLRILLAEDNPINQRLALRMLEKRGHQVTVVGHGREALTLLEKHPFDLVLMDVQMPEMDGFETTAAIRIKEKTDGGHLPIIAMTALTMKGDRERCLDSGMDGYVLKPIRTKELFATIEEVLAASQPAGSAGSPIHIDQGRILSEESDEGPTTVSIDRG